MAEGTNVAEIGDTKYTSLEEALDAAKSGDDVTLLDAATLAGDATVKSGVTLVVPEGMTLTVSGTLTVNGTLTNNGTVNGEGVVVVAGTLDGNGALDATTKYVVKVIGSVRWNNALGASVDSSVNLEHGKEYTFYASSSYFTEWKLPTEGFEGKADGPFLTFSVYAPCTIEAKAYTPAPAPTPLTVDPVKLTLEVGETGQVTANKEGVTWTSADEKIVTVDNKGLVTAVAEGEVKITATLGNQSASCDVTVSDVEHPAEGGGLGIDVLTIKKGKVMQPPNFTGYTGKWVIEDESVVKLSKKGNFKALKLGETRAFYKVTGVSKKAIKLNDRVLNVGETYVLTVLVRKAGEQPTSIAVEPKKLTLAPGESAKLIPTVKPAKALDKEVFFTSNKPEIATVEADGVVTARKPGKCKITAYTANLKKKTVNVTVSGLVTKLEILDEGGAVIKKGSTVKLAVGEVRDFGVRANKDALDKSVTWKSGKPNIASVDPETGLLTPLKAGTTKITVTAKDGSGTKVSITVKVVI